MVSWGLPEPQRRRRRGLMLGGAGFGLLFGSAIALLFVPQDYAVWLLVLMVVGIVLLVAGMLSVPGSLRDMLRPKV